MLSLVQILDSFLLESEEELVVGAGTDRLGDAVQEVFHFFPLN